MKNGKRVNANDNSTNPNSANALDSLAEAYLLSGNKAEAIKNYEKAVKINPNFQSSIEALRKLKN